MTLFPISELYLALAGTIGGLFIALGGWLKDQRWEPFSIKKFLRTPAITIFWSFVLPMFFFFDEWIIVMLCCVSMERITTEIWKVAVRKKHKPDKFKNSVNRDTRWASPV